MIKRIIFKIKNNLLLKVSLLLFLFIIFLYLISFYYFFNREYFNIPIFDDKNFIIPTNKEGEVVNYLDKKSLNNLNNKIPDFKFKNVNELNFTIQLYSDDSFEDINTYINHLLENKKEIIDQEDIFVFYKKTSIGTQYFITYKNYISKNDASQACDILTIVNNCLILNLQN